MCGIAGMVATYGASVEPERLATMLRAMAHRGPDGQGIYTCGEAGLAHARLSIIDIEGGRQPMSIDNGRFWITFNGEIFNYIELREELIRKGHFFVTRSDTEVILHLYQEMGEECVKELNGQWAFAIWDASLHKLFLSRDRLGVRPLFYTQTAKGFRFASEIKALHTCPDVPRELDLQGLDQIFTYWVTVPPRTAFRGIQQLPPGHSLVFEDGRVRIQEYWKLAYIPADDQTAESEQKLTEELLALLQDATRIRLRADVPVGAYLSGGLDSTFITALTQSFMGDRLRTFSISFDEEEFDESCYQHEASSFLGTHHTDIRCSRDDIARIFPMVIWHVEQPIIRTAPAPMFLLSQLVRRSGFKVVLTGEGADETLGGYDILKETKIRQFWGRRPSSQWRPLLLKRLYPYLEGIQRQPTAYLKGFFHVSEEDLANPYFSHLPRWELTARLKTLLSNESRKELSAHPGMPELDDQMPEGFASWEPFNRAEYLETKYLLPGYILSSQGDRMAMAHAVEGRYPFLDHRVVEFAAKLPPNLKMKAIDQKYLLKRAAAGRIPESIRKRYKQPYRAPEGKSFLQDTDDYAQYLLSAESIRNWGVFNPQGVDALVAKFKSGRAFSTKDNMALVGVLSTQILLDQFVGKGAVPPQAVVPETSTAGLWMCA
jgi:asparagine synthase (glutamine-hydrolysing)